MKWNRGAATAGATTVTAHPPCPMSITVKYFASLAEAIGRREDRLEAGAAATVAEAWDALNAPTPMPDNVLCAVNHEYVERTRRIGDGDEVAFFPPVTGG